jgi:uncharacterized protein YndB with AHSA1/START domain
MSFPFRIDPALDLVLERTVDVPPHLVWLAWTTPEHVKKWFTPAPWRTTACEIDLRPGGRFFTVMEGPQGEHFQNEGCWLELVPNRRLSWTNALAPGFRPVPPAATSGDTVSFPFTAIVSMEAHGAQGTRYRAVALHQNPKDREVHAGMGFDQGWGKALEQLVAAMKALPGGAQQ